MSNNICNICGLPIHKGKCNGIKPSKVLLPWPEWDKFAHSILNKVDKDTEAWLRKTFIKELMEGVMNDEDRRKARWSHYLGFIEGIKYCRKD